MNKRQYPFDDPRYYDVPPAQAKIQAAKQTLTAMQPSCLKLPCVGCPGNPQFGTDFFLYFCENCYTTHRSFCTVFDEAPESVITIGEEFVDIRYISTRDFRGRLWIRAERSVVYGRNRSAARGSPSKANQRLPRGGACARGSFSWRG